MHHFNVDSISSVASIFIIGKEDTGKTELIKILVKSTQIVCAFVHPFEDWICPPFAHHNMNIFHILVDTVEQRSKQLKKRKIQEPASCLIVDDMIAEKLTDEQIELKNNILIPDIWENTPAVKKMLSCVVLNARFIVASRFELFKNLDNINFIDYVFIFPQDMDDDQLARIYCFYCIEGISYTTFMSYAHILSPHQSLVIDKIKRTMFWFSFKPMQRLNI